MKKENENFKNKGSALMSMSVESYAELKAKCQELALSISKDPLARPGSHKKSKQLADEVSVMVSEMMRFESFALLSMSNDGEAMVAQFAKIEPGEYTLFPLTSSGPSVSVH